MRDHFDNQLTKTLMRYGKNILHVDDYEGTVNYTKTTTNCTGLVEKSTSYSYNGNSSLHINTFDATPAANDAVYANRLNGFPMTERIKLNTKLLSPAWNKILDFKIYLDVYDGSQRNNYAMFFTISENRPKNVISPGITSPVYGSDIILEDDIWYDFEIIINVIKKTYDSLKFGSNVYTFAANYPHYIGAATNKRIDLRYFVRNVGNNISDMYFDNTIIESI